MKHVADSVVQLGVIIIVKRSEDDIGCITY